MELTIKLNETETNAYAMTIAEFLQKIGGGAHVQPTAAPVPMLTTPTDPEPAETPASNPPAVDSAGMPWDERIHSPNKTQIANGQWRKKKGISDQLVAQVESELRGAPQPTVASAPAPDQFAQFAQPVQMTGAQAQDALMGQFGKVPAPAADQFAQFAAQQQPVAMPANMPQQPVQQPQQVAGPTDFPSFMKVLANSVNTGKVDPNYITSLCQRIGVNAIPDLSVNPAKIGEAYNLMVCEGRV